jgi:hypothetical protein
MDPALNKNEPEFRVLVLPVPLKMLPNGHGLLDEEVEVLWDVRGQTYTPPQNPRMSMHLSEHRKLENNAVQSDKEWI